MTMYFYEDFWESIQKLPDRKDREAAAYAMLEYYFSGESTTDNPIASMAFGLVKGRIDKSIVNQRNGSKGGAKKWQNARNANSEGKSVANSDASGFATTNPNSNSNPVSKPNKRKTGAVDFGNEAEREAYPLAYHCLKLFNRTLNRRCQTMQHEVVSYLQGLSVLPSDDEIVRMIKAKENEWSGDPKTKAWLNQDTLFRARNFLGYIDKTKAERDPYAWLEEYSDDC